MKTLPEYEELAAVAHGHLCAGQILGLRMALHGMDLLEIEDPAGKDRKRLVTFVEIDRCATDAITVVTGCRLGKRALKFRDFGKMAATFVDVKNDRAVRLSARESSKERAKELFPEIEDKNRQQMTAYRDLPVEELFEHQWVRVRLGPEDFPGYKSERRICAACGEGISFDRFWSARAKFFAGGARAKDIISRCDQNPDIGRGTFRGWRGFHSGAESRRFGAGTDGDGAGGDEAGAGAGE